MTSAADLFTLQDIDLRRDSRRALIADIDLRLGETDAVIAAREAVATATAIRQSRQQEQRQIETQLEDLDAKTRPLEAKLYDGSVRNPKELADMQHEVEGLKERRRGLDDQGLALLDAAEAATAALAEAEVSLRQAEAGWRTDQAALQAERARAEEQAAALAEERGHWTANMDTGSLGLYENLRQQRQGRAVAPIVRGACDGCHVSLPTYVVQRVRSGTVLIQCPRCERILVGA